MIRSSLHLVSILFCVLLLAQTSFADSYEITIRVTDADGKSVEGAIVSCYWDNRDESGFVDTVNAREDVRVLTQADGTAKLRIDNWDRARSVMIQSSDGTQSAIIQVGPEDHKKEFDVKLEPTISVTGSLICEDLEDIQWTNTVVSPGPKTQDFLIQWSATDGKFKFAVPQGTYTLYLYGSHVTGKTQTIKIPAGKPSFDLGEITMEVDPQRRLIGKPAPALTISEARGVDFDAEENNNQLSLEQYKGKWVLLEFWGHW